MAIKEKAQSEVAAELLQTVIDTFPMPTFWKDTSLRYIGCNQQFLDYEGFSSKDQVIGKLDTQLPWNAYAKRYQEHDRSILESGLPTIEYREQQIRSDGSIHYYKTSKLPMYNISGEVEGILCFYQDITQQYAAEKALISSDNKYRSLIETTGTGFLVLDRNAKIIDANAEYLRIAGEQNKTDVIGSFPTPGQGLNSQIPDVLQSLLLSESHLKGVEVDYQHDDGAIITAEINASSVASEDGKTVLALFRDVTQRKHIEKQLRNKDHFLAHVLNDLLSYVGILDAEGRVIFINT